VARRAGVTFDSLLQRAWADAFTAAGIRFEYTGRNEVGWPISSNPDGATYRPDFLLVDLDVWVEVKPSGRDIKAELWKYAAFKRRVLNGELPGRDAVVATGRPTRKKLKRSGAGPTAGAAGDTGGGPTRLDG
jgi:hypothetical protein